MSSTDNGPSLVAESSAWIGLSTIAIVLRFWSRSLLPSRKFQSDDWTALAAYPFEISALTMVMMWAMNGLGTHNPAQSPAALDLEVAKKLLWNTGITLSRISVICFYRRLFSTKRFRILFWIGITANVLWWWTLFLFVLLGCEPIQKQWDHSIQGTCMDELPGQILSSLTSFLVDLYILVIPFPFMIRLQMPWTRKVAVVMIFLLGYALVVTVQNSAAINTDPNWGYGLQEFWAMCEVAVSFIGASIPAIFTLVRRGLQFGPVSLFNDHEYSQSSQSQLSSDPSKGASGVAPSDRVTSGTFSSDGKKNMSYGGYSSSDTSPNPAISYPRPFTYNIPSNAQQMRQQTMPQGWE